MLDTVILDLWSSPFSAISDSLVGLSVFVCHQCFGFFSVIICVCLCMSWNGRCLLVKCWIVLHLTLKKRDFFSSILAVPRASFYVTSPSVLLQADCERDQGWINLPLWLADCGLFYPPGDCFVGDKGLWFWAFRWDALGCRHQMRFNVTGLKMRPYNMTCHLFSAGTISMSTCCPMAKRTLLYTMAKAVTETSLFPSHWCQSLSQYIYMIL